MSPPGEPDENPLIISVAPARTTAGLDRSEWADLVETLERLGFEFIATKAADVASARVDGRLRMPDACVLATARVTGADRVLTFDAALRAAATADGFA